MKISEKLPPVDDMPSINVEVELQNPCNYSSIPSTEELESWSASALQSGVAEQKKLPESGGVTLIYLCFVLYLYCPLINQKEIALR